MAGFSVENFSAALKTSGARANLFTVTIAQPTADLGTDVTNNISKKDDKATQFEFLCNATTLPGYVQGEVPVSYFGRTIYLAGDTTFGDWSTTILNDEGMRIRRGIESWMEKINGASSGKRTGVGVSHNELTTTATIKTFSIDGSSEVTVAGSARPITQVVLKGVWPSNLSPIELSHDAVNTIETFTCTWQYQHAEHS